MALKLNRFKRVQVMQALSFPKGLYGFEEIVEFTLRGGEELPFLRLVGGGVTFAVIDPFLVFPEYDPHVVVEGHECFLLSIVKLRGDDVFVNLAAPLLIDWEKKSGKQLLLVGEDPSHRVGLKRLDEFRH